MLAGPPRKSGRDNKPAGGGGFGAQRKKAGPEAPTLEAVLARWPTRAPADAASPCACGSGDSYADCCRRYHEGLALSETPTRLLRTRYSAFAYRLPGHLIRTTHRTNRDWRDDRVAWARQLNREGMFDSFDFLGLQHGPHQAGEQHEKAAEGGAQEEPREAGADPDEACISFRVVLRNRETGSEVGVRERSRFVREAGEWLYASGEVGTDGDLGLDILNK
jgi:SEC-C motif-containing protein